MVSFWEGRKTFMLLEKSWQSNTPVFSKPSFILSGTTDGEAKVRGSEVITEDLVFRRANAGLLWDLLLKSETSMG